MKFATEIHPSHITKQKVIGAGEWQPCWDNLLWGLTRRCWKIFPIPKFAVYIVHFPQLNRLTDSGYFSEINIYLAQFSHNKLRHFVVWQLLAVGSMCFGSRWHEQLHRGKCCRNSILEGYQSTFPGPAQIFHDTFIQVRPPLPFEPTVFFQHPSPPQFPRPWPPPFSSCDSWFPCFHTTGHLPIIQQAFSQHPARTHLCERASGKTAAETSLFTLCCTENPCN